LSIRNGPTLKAGQNLEKAFKDLIEAVEKESALRLREDTTGKKKTLMEKAKLLFNNVKGKRESVLKAIDVLEAFTGSFMQKVEKYAKGVQDLEKELQVVESKAKGNNEDIAKQAADLVKKMAGLLYKIEVARKKLQNAAPLFVEGRKAVDSANLDKVTQLKGVLGKIQSFVNDDSVRAFAGEGKELITTGAKLVGSILKSVA